MSTKLPIKDDNGAGSGQPQFTSEGKYQSWANGILNKLGWWYYHTEKGRTPGKKQHNYIMFDMVKCRFLDLIILKPGVEKPIFIELKMPGKKPSIEQQNMINWLREHGYTVYVCTTKEEFLTALGVK